jgi:hypothetical protein
MPITSRVSTMAASEAFSSATATRPDARRAEVVGHRQHTGHRAHRAAEGQLADEPVAFDPERAAAEAEDGGMTEPAWAAIPRIATVKRHPSARHRRGP